MVKIRLIFGVLLKCNSDNWLLIIGYKFEYFKSKVYFIFFFIDICFDYVIKVIVKNLII